MLFTFLQFTPSILVALAILAEAGLTSVNEDTYNRKDQLDCVICEECIYDLAAYPERYFGECVDNCTSCADAPTYNNHLEVDADETEVKVE